MTTIEALIIAGRNRVTHDNGNGRSKANCAMRESPKAHGRCYLVYPIVECDASADSERTWTIYSVRVLIFLQQTCANVVGM